ncbi:Origin recognition complex subunit 5 [Globomyces sp. JEL0801]|nr:Origin recognition complex subunit 5 [Globomyces sp. JEL0801]
MDCRHRPYFESVSQPYFSYIDTKRMDLPHYTKFLVMASFLASYNPARLDKRFFTRGGEGKTRVGKKGGVNNGSKLRQQLLGPKSFTVERMIAIFYSIIDDDDLRATFDIHTQVIQF